jgi:YVTN family beta-propeller protein
MRLRFNSAALGWTIFAGILVGATGCSRVGVLGPDGISVNTGQLVRPDGRLTVFSARPVDLTLTPNGKTAYVKENEGLTVVDVASGEVRQRLPLKGGSSLTGLALNPAGTRLYYSNSASEIHEIDVSGTTARLVKSFTMPIAKVGGAAYPCGLAIHDNHLYAALSRSNLVADIDLATGKILRTIPVAPAPFSVAVDPATGSLWVSTWGVAPTGNRPSAKSSGTSVVVDRRGIAIAGTVAEINLATGKLMRSVVVGAQASEIVVGKDQVWVTVANADSVVSIPKDPTKGRTAWRASIGAAPSSLTALSDGSLAVACSGSNEVVVLRNGKAAETYRSGWYPTAVRAVGTRLVVASAKGLGVRGNDLRQGKFDAIAKTEKFPSRLTKAAAKSYGVYQFTGTVNVVNRSSKTAKPEAIAAELPARPNVKPVPIPERAGEPSVFKHVVYILKENRTYDQVFGDMPAGDGDLSMCIYGEKVTPNQHALARQFVLLDNYYCNGVLSADGHSWSTEGNATSYFERSFGGWTRSYPYGDDPLAISSTGHIWDAVLDKGLTFKNYGEYDYTEPTKGEKHTEILRDFLSGKREIKFKHTIGIDRLRRYTDPECPGWNMEIPDILRASYFIRDVRAAEKTGKLPNFNFVYLPQDHTSGGGAGVPTPEAHVADNDLAVGRVVDAVSKSRFWKDTVIFVIEDDPQGGFDHVDGHRSTCLVISPYTRRGAVVSNFYNQAAVLKSIRHIFGIAPATRFEKIAQLMDKCFTSKPNFRPFTALPNRIPLDQMNPTKSAMRKLDLTKPDRVDEDAFNRQLWQAAGKQTPYPAHLAGAHGTGLASRGLTIVPGAGVGLDD